MKLRIRTLRQAAHLTLEELAARAGISRSYLTELELGAKTINAMRLQQVARALNVEPTDLFEPTPHWVAVVGQVGAGASVPLLDVADQGGHFFVQRPPQLAGREVAAVEVVGNSMSPMYYSGSILFYHRTTHEGVPVADIGHPCIVADDGGNAWVKLVKRGSEPNTWNLISLNPDAESVWHVHIRWAARVLIAIPGELVLRSSDTNQT